MNYFGYRCSVTSTKLDILIKQNILFKNSTTEYIKIYNLHEMSKCQCLQLFQTTIRTGLVHKKNYKNYFEYKIQDCKTNLSE